MANDYDKILKENIEAIFPSLSKNYLGIEIAQSEPLKDKLQDTLEREADFLQKVTTTQGEQLIVHLEFQSTDDASMIKRMKLYEALLDRKYDLPIKQFVIYLGRKTPQMRTQVESSKIYKGFQLINLQTLDYEPLLNSKIPEEVILAILSNFESREAGQLLTQIIERLTKLIDNPATLQKYTYHLVTLARLRNLTQVTKQTLNNMAITYDIKKDAFYQEGIKQNMREIVSNMKKAGFSTEDIIKATGLTKEQIDKIS